MATNSQRGYPSGGKNGFLGENYRVGQIQGKTLWNPYVMWESEPL